MIYGWWDYGASPPWYGMLFGPIMMIIVAVLAVVIIEWLLRTLGPDRQFRAHERSASEMVQDNFAHGEIDRAKHEEGKQVLSGL
jgi:uncharacterized membrane protein